MPLALFNPCSPCCASAYGRACVVATFTDCSGWATCLEGFATRVRSLGAMTQSSWDAQKLSLIFPFGVFSPGCGDTPDGGKLVDYAFLSDQTVLPVTFGVITDAGVARASLFFGIYGKCPPAWRTTSPPLQALYTYYQPVPAGPPPASYVFDADLTIPWNCFDSFLGGFPPPLAGHATVTITPMPPDVTCVAASDLLIPKRLWVSKVPTGCVYAVPDLFPIDRVGDSGSWVYPGSPSDGFIPVSMFIDNVPPPSSAGAWVDGPNVHDGNLTINSFDPFDATSTSMSSGVCSSVHITE